jgi:hypothetical protein
LKLSGANANNSAAAGVIAKKGSLYVQTSVCAVALVMYNINLHCVISFKILRDLKQ